MRYKNTSDKEMTIPGIGKVKGGEEIEAKEINNANFEEVKKEEKKVDIIKK